VKTRLQRVGIVAAMGVVTLNIWTGAPLLGLWVGSRVAPESGISMLAVFVIAVVIGATAWILLQVLGYLQLAYARLGGRPVARRQTTWLRPMSGARTGKGAEVPPLSPTDYVVVGVVILAVAAFEVWFFFFAGSSLRAG
jgi:hypothetical protein